MAQGSDTKLYVALGVLAVMGGAYYVQQQSKQEAAKEHSFEAVSQELPQAALSEEETKKITKIVIQKPGKEGDEDNDAEPAVEHVLLKEGETWQLESPVKALANQKNIESLLENLTKLEVKEKVASSKDSYGQYDVNEGKALHAAFYEGDKLVREVWAGKSGGRGQMARVDGSDGVFILDGFSKFLYNRDTKGWRDLSILELDPEEATAITIENENGEFSFEKEEGAWKGKFKKGGSPFGTKIDEFEPKKVEDLLKAYKKLNATGFGDDKKLADVGLEEPKAKLTVQLGEDKTVVAHFGEAAEGSSKWMKLPDEDQIYSISSWAADWAFAEEEKFQKADEEEEDGGPGGPPGGMPSPMGMPPGMPAGHP